MCPKLKRSTELPASMVYILYCTIFRVLSIDLERKTARQTVSHLNRFAGLDFHKFDQMAEFGVADMFSEEWRTNEEAFADKRIVLIFLKMCVLSYERKISCS